MPPSDPNESTKHFDATPTDRVEEEVRTPDWIGRYRVSKLVGKGGFGAVFKAVDASLDRDVAIKIPRRRQKEIEDFTPWMSEARTVAMLDHPHIVPVYDVGTTDEFPFFVVSKFIEGGDLRTVMNRGKPSLNQSVRWVAQIADALQHAHTHGLVHRDVKPSNVLIGKQNHPWLTDFGLALHDEEIGQDQSRKLIGTVSYMSPEQARGEGHLVDGRADVFALGIILYELLCGSRPFKGHSSEQLLRNIIRAEPRPLRQWDANLPIELERICMKALAQRRSDRYGSADELASDLRHLAEDVDDLSRRSSNASGLADEEPAEAPIVPKGLRSFDEHDREFFLKLVPGPRDRSGIPELLRRLRMRIERRREDETFRVGLIYGPSGSGKSSLIRAGLIPLLDSSVDVIYVEADAHHTESRLLEGLRPLSGDFDCGDDLVQNLTAIRQRAGQRKVLIVLDQFEQWLHSHPLMADTELVNALRQCDGTGAQCLLLIRDDFWMPATQFFHELEIRLVQDVNSCSVDRFESRHARFVLREFGRAYGCLPEDLSEITDEQNRFLDQVIESLQEDGKIISVHLVVIAQMLKGHPWSIETLQRFGGTSGVDINFLDATFSDSVASPHLRSLQVPARAVLAALLPEMDTNIKGQMQESEHLRDVAGLRPQEFEQLLEVLDGELRLITPTVAVGEADGKQTCYQLTHDFLVPPLREWLNRNESRTAKGRARLRLRELSQYYREKNDSRFLPNQNEFVRIMALTSAKGRTSDEGKLVKAAARHHGMRWAIVAAVVAALGIGAFEFSRRTQENVAANEASAAVERLLAADPDKRPEIIDQIESNGADVQPLLQGIVDSPDRSPEEKRVAMLVLVEDDPRWVTTLVDATMVADPTESRLICERLSSHREVATTQLWELVESGLVDESHWLGAAYALAQLDPTSSNWEQHSDRLARALVNQTTPRVVEMADGFANLADQIVEPTLAYYHDDQHEDARVNSAVLLSSVLSPSDPVLAELLVTASPSQFEILFPVIAEQPNSIERVLRSELNARPQTEPSLRPSEQSEVNASEIALIESAGGEVTPSFAWCDSLPLSRFDELAEQMQQCGYRPAVIRPYAPYSRREGVVQVAVVWWRDARQWRLTQHAGPDGTAALATEMRKKGLYPADIAAIREEPQDDELRYFILWTTLNDSVVDARMYVGVTEQDHGSLGWGPLNDEGYVPRVNMKTYHPDGTERYSSVRWKTVINPTYADAWNDTRSDCNSRSLDGWHQVDLRVNQPGDFTYDDSYGAIWWNAGASVQSKTVLGCDPTEHRDQAHALTKKGYRLVSLSVADDTDGRLVGSVWHRPIPTERERDRIASRQANALIALLRLGSTDELWPKLRHAPDPRLRSFLVNRLHSFGADPQILVTWLLAEPDTERRFAMIAALSQYRSEQLPADVSSALREQIRKWGSEHPSAAIHSICQYLCTQWGWNDTLREMSSADAPETDVNFDATATPTWSKAVEGHTMIEIRDPPRIVFGSPGHEPFRDHSAEVTIRGEIPRDFAISTSETTLEQFQRFDELHGYASEYTPSRDCPANSASWYDAVRYCRWLSEQANIDEDQMCYPPIDQIQVGFQQDPDMLKRSGFRLPTEAEWEYACRAGTITSRYYGAAPELLSRYAWNMDNATIDAKLAYHPVNSRLPNAFGAFDMLGNVMEWCVDYQSRNGATQRVLIDSVAGREVGTTRILRGSSIFYIPSSLRSAVRERAFPTSQHPYSGFRIARTILDE